MTGYWDKQIGTWLPDDPKFYCQDCEEEVLEDELNEVKGGKQVCDNCYYSYYQECDVCGEMVHQDELQKMQDGRMICESCYDNSDYAKCDICDDICDLSENKLDRDVNSKVFVCDKCKKELSHL